MLRKLAQVEHEKYCNFFYYRKKLRAISFEEPINILTKDFSEKNSLFDTHCKCMNLTKEEDENIDTYDGIVNKDCERFTLKN